MVALKFIEVLEVRYYAPIDSHHAFDIEFLNVGNVVKKIGTTSLYKNRSSGSRTIIWDATGVLQPEDVMKQNNVLCFFCTLTRSRASSL